MGTHIVIEGNAFYEVDESCLRRQMGQQGPILEGERKEERLESVDRKHPAGDRRKRK